MVSYFFGKSGIRFFEFLDLFHDPCKTSLDLVHTVSPRHSGAQNKNSCRLPYKTLVVSGFFRHPPAHEEVFPVPGEEGRVMRPDRQVFPKDNPRIILRSGHNRALP